MAEMEKLIAEEESASAAEHEALVEASQAGDGGLIASLSKSAHDRAERIDALYEELDGFTRLYEDLSTQFDVELAALGGEGAA